METQARVPAVITSPPPRTQHGSRRPFWAWLVYFGVFVVWACAASISSCDRARPRFPLTFYRHRKCKAERQSRQASGGDLMGLKNKSAAREHVETGTTHTLLVHVC